MEFQDRDPQVRGLQRRVCPGTAGEQQFFADKNFKNEPKRCQGLQG